jgi:hypothetical protein
VLAKNPIVGIQIPSQNFAFRVRNSTPRLEFPPSNKILRARNSSNFCPHQISAKSLYLLGVQAPVIGPEIWAGNFRPEFPPLAKFWGPKNPRDFHPCEIWLSPSRRHVVLSAVRLPKIQNF